MKRILLFACLLLFTALAFGQSVAINNTGNAPDVNAILDVQSAEKGVLLPRLSGTARSQIINPANGLLVYDSDTKSFWYYKTGSGWIDISKLQLPAAVNIDYPGFGLFVNNTNNTTANTAIAAYSSKGTSLRAVNTAADGTALFAQNTNGIAGNFIGRLQVLHNSGLNSGQLTLEDATANNYTRLILKNSSSSRQWTMAALNTTGSSAGDRLNFYHSTAGDALSISGDGKVVVGGVTATNNAKLDVQGGNINTDAKITRTASGTANMVPLAYGTVHYSGSIYNTTGNFSATVNGAVTIISIPGETIALGTHMAMVSLVDAGQPGMYHVWMESGILRVTTYDRNGNPLPFAFSFVIYKN